MCHVIPATGEYFGEMPWLALPFAERDTKGALSKVGQRPASTDLQPRRPNA